MEGEFSKNLFVMLLAIMIGAVVITYFVADIVNRSTIDTLKTQHDVEIEGIQTKNENFVSHFIESTVILDKAREYRAFGNYHFDLAFLWYQSALSETNSTLFDSYKLRGIDNCTNAMPKYDYSNKNFNEAEEYFIVTRSNTTNTKYIEVINIYINLTKSGSRLTMLRYNASKYLKYLTENLTIKLINDTLVVGYMENMTDILFLFNQSMNGYQGELDIYEEYQDEIDEYEFFDEIR